MTRGCPGRHRPVEPSPTGRTATLGPMSRSVEELRSLSDANLAGLWTRFCSALGGAIGGSPQCPFAVTGLPLAPFNGAIVLERLDDPAAMLDEATAFMADHGVPFLVWVRDGVDPTLVERALDVGFVEVGRPPAMALSPIGRIPHPPADVTVEEIVDEAGIADYRRVLHQGFGLPDDLLERIATPETAWGDGFAAVVIRAGGEPAACAHLAITGTTAGIFNVATVPDHRRRGLGAAATWAAIDIAATRGCDHAILQSTAMGHSVYRGMGFEVIGHYHQLAAPDAAV